MHARAHICGAVATLGLALSACGGASPPSATRPSAVEAAAVTPRAAPAPEGSPTPTPTGDTPAASPDATLALAIDDAHAVALESLGPSRSRARRVASTAQTLEVSPDSHTLSFLARDTRPGAPRSLDPDALTRFVAPLDRTGPARLATDTPAIRAAAPAPPSPAQAARADLARRSSPQAVAPAVIASPLSTSDARYLSYLVLAPAAAGGARRIEIRQTDVEAATHRLLATARAVSAQLYPVPGTNRFVVAVQWSLERASIFELDAQALSARRIHDGPGIVAETHVSPDARHVAFVLQPYYAGRAPPPQRERAGLPGGERRPACDPIGSMCGQPGGCGYLSDGCGGYFDCGPCPSELPPPPGPQHGLFVAPLTALP